MAAYRALESARDPAGFCGGHSLGEYSALVAAGALEFADAVKLVRQRGRYMQEAVPAGEGAMAAILGLSPGGCGRSLQEGRGGRSGFAREFEFAGADRDFRQRRGGEARR